MSLNNELMFTGYDPTKNPEDMSMLSQRPYFLSGNISDMDPAKAPDPEKWGLRIENQGQIGSCAGNSLTTCVEVCKWNKQNRWINQLSRMYAYIETQKIDGINGDSGSTITGGIKLAKNKGLILESLYPYPNSYPGHSAHNRKIQDPSIVNAEKFLIDTHVNIQTWEQALVWVYSGGSLHMGTYWPIDLDSSGVCRRYSYGRGMHATAGVGLVYTGREWLIKTANSHSSRFGKLGYYFWSQPAFERMLNTRNCVVIGVGVEGQLSMDHYDFLKKGLGA